MTISSANLVQGLSGAIAASALGNVVCLSPAPVDPSYVFSVQTLDQLAREVKRVDEKLGRELEENIPSAQLARKDPEELHRAWLEYTKIIEGKGKRGKSKTDPVQDPVSAAIEKLSAGPERRLWIEGVLSKMGVPAMVMRSALTWIDSVGGDVGLKFSSKSQGHYTSRVVNARGGGPVIEISIPRTRRVLTVKELDRLIGLAMAVEGLKPVISATSAKDLQRVSVASIGRPILGFVEIDLLQRFVEALGDKRFRKYRPIVPLEKGFSAVFDSGVLLALSEAIAKDYPGLGARLYCIAVKVATGKWPQTISHGWNSFVNALKDADSNIGREIVDMGVLKSAVARLGVADKGRREWLMDALNVMQVPSPAKVLDSKPLSLRMTKEIYLELKDVSGDEFLVSADYDRNKIIVSISIPGRTKISSEDEIRYLVARAVLLGKARESLTKSLYDRYRKVSPSKLTRPVRLAVFDYEAFTAADRAIELGSTGISDYGFKALGDVYRWLRVGSKMVHHVYAPRDDLTARLMRESADYLEKSAAKERAKSSIAMERQNRLYWQGMLSLPGMMNVFFDKLNLVRHPRYSLVFEVDDGRGENISISYLGDLKEHCILVRLSSEVMKKLKPKDLLGILVRATIPTVSKKGGHSYAEVEVPLGTLRGARDLEPAPALERSLLILAHEYRGITSVDDDGIQISGNIGDYELRRFATTLDAIARFYDMTDMDVLRAAWSEVLSVRRWYLHDGGLRGRAGTVDVIPLGAVGLIHAHSISDVTDAKHWLRVMSALAANPGHAIRVENGGIGFALSWYKDADKLYGSIAANRMFEPFGLYDPDAQMPERTAMQFPGGVMPEANPGYASASHEERQGYIRALRWFAVAGIPEEWKPSAGDGRQTVKKKRRAMSLAWHPDRNPDREHANLLSISNTYWDAVESMCNN